MTCPLKFHLLPQLVSCGILSATPAAVAEVRQWGEAIGFEEFGIATPTIVLESHDTLNTSVNINIGAGDFVAAVHATASYTRPWGMTLSGTDTAHRPMSVTFLSAVSDTVLAFDDMKSMRVIMVRQTTGNNSATTVIPCKDGFLKGYPATCSMVIERHDETWTITLKPDNGKAESYTPAIKAPDFPIESLGITVPPGKPHRKGGFGKRSDKAEIHRATVHYNPVPPMASLTSTDALTSHFLRSTDPLEGYYRISERSFDEQYLRPGGDYVLAMMRTPDGGYDIIYITGATQLPSAWQTGMVHGHAVPTANPMQYTATWTDARYRPITGEILMTVDGSGLITLQFPYLFSTVRLQRLTPSSIHQ